MEGWLKVRQRERMERVKGMFRAVVGGRKGRG